VHRHALLQAGQVDLDELGQVGRQAGNIELGHHVVDHAGLELDRQRFLGVDIVQRHLHVQLGPGVHALEVDVQHLLLVRVHLHVAQQDPGLLAVQFHVQDGGVERFLLQGVPQRVVIELDQQRLAFASIDDAGRLARIAQTAARTRTLLCALISDEFHDLLQKESTATSVTPGLKRPAGNADRSLAQNRFS
jgi:hypothetical protein